MSERNDYLWDPSENPDPEVVRLEQALEEFRFDPNKGARLVLPSQRPRGRRIFLAAAAIVTIVGGVVGTWRYSKADPWTVETITGNPRVTRGANGRIAAGGLVVTDANSSARIAVGGVGVADVGPGSTVEVLRTDDGEHRLALERGILHASIWARPRFFVVETPAATAVDLGCVYTLSVDSAGTGMLAVTVGEVQLASGAPGVLVAAGTAARIYPTHVGLPFPINATAAFRNAVRLADETALSDSIVDVLLRESDVQGTITLFHLLRRESPTMRSRTYDRLSTLVSPPPGVTREAVANLDSAAMTELMDALRSHWSSEPRSAFRRLLVRMGLVKPVMQLAVRRAIAEK
jgi:hypothetical protein